MTSLWKKGGDRLSGGGIDIPGLRQSGFDPSVTAFGPGRKRSLLPALATNVPLARLLNASRPFRKGSLEAPQGAAFPALLILLHS